MVRRSSRSMPSAVADRLVVAVARRTPTSRLDRAVVEHRLAVEAHLDRAVHARAPCAAARARRRSRSASAGASASARRRGATARCSSASRTMSQPVARLPASSRAPSCPAGSAAPAGTVHVAGAEPEQPRRRGRGSRRRRSASPTAAGTSTRPTRSAPPARTTRSRTGTRTPRSAGTGSARNPGPVGGLEARHCGQSNRRSTGG